MVRSSAGYSFVAAALALIGSAASCLADDVKPTWAAYFPLRAGLAWKYHSVASNPTAGKVYEELDLVRKVANLTVKPDGTPTADISEIRGGVGTTSDQFRVSGAGVFLVQTTTPGGAVKPESPQPTLRGELKPGATWSWKGKLVSPLASTLVTYSSTAVGLEDVTVPAGKFHALHVHRTLSSADTPAPRVIDDWYAPGVGLVMDKDVVGPFQSVLKLTEFQGGAAAAPVASTDTSKLAVRELFPLSPGSRWVYSGDQLAGGDFEIKVVRVTPASAKSEFSVVLERTAIMAGKQVGVGVEERMTATDTEIRPVGIGENDAPRFMELRFLSPAIRFPVKAGDTWQSDGTFKVNGLTGRVQSKFTVGSREPVTTPAGAFQAWKVHEAVNLAQDGKGAGSPASVDTWFAPGVGVVKRVVKSPLGDFEQTLKSFQIK